MLKLLSKKDADLLLLDETIDMPEKSIVLPLILMYDPVWVCLFKADFSDKQNIRGNLRFKQKISDLEDLVLDKVELNKLHFGLQQD